MKPGSIIHYISDDGSAIETMVEHNANSQQLVRSDKLAGTARSRDDTALALGRTLLSLLVILHPEVFERFPHLIESPMPSGSDTDTPEVAIRRMQLEEEKRRMQKELKDMEAGLGPDNE